VMVSTASVLVNAALSVALVRQFGYLGLAVGTSVTALLNAGVLLALLRRRIGGIEGVRLLGVFARSLAAALLMAAAAFVLHEWLRLVLPGHALVLQLARVGAGIAIGLIVLVLGAWLFALHEINDVRRAFTARLGRSRGA
jgi:putative peptidoglycan lipid II flippase